VIIGLDTNIICYALDEDYPENKQLNDLLLNLSSENKIAINPTAIHEAYHVLVFGEKWFPEDAAHAIKLLLKNPYIEFYNQTRKTSTVALDIAVQYKLGGRDALIAASYIANRTPILYTHDKELLKCQKITWKNSNLAIEDPLQK
jgi:Predicted nucleic-acid-binding protein, contains PIN domain